MCDVFDGLPYDVFDGLPYERAALLFARIDFAIRRDDALTVAEKDAQALAIAACESAGDV